MNSRFRAQAGFSIVEVLVAVLILAFGILSIGMMMLTTTQNTRGAALRNRAVALAQDMAERIRANPEGQELYDTALTVGANHGCFQQTETPPDACTATELAEHDVFQWSVLLQDPVVGLPDGTGTVTRSTAVVPPQFDIRVTWTDGVNETGPVQQSLVLSTRP